MHRLRFDEDALNWCVHDLFCDRHVAGNDAYLFDLILEIPIPEKLAVCAAACDFWGSENIQALHMPALDELIDTIALFCQANEIDRIEWLPTNENLLQNPADATLCSIGKLGASAVQLEASPVNTLPKSLLIEYSRFFEEDERVANADYYSAWPLASQLWLKLIYSLGSKVRESLGEADEAKQDFDLDSLCKKVSGGMTKWAGLVNHRWNGYYPSSWIDQQDVTTSAGLLELRPHVDDDRFDEMREVIARVYHISDIDSAYAGGMPDAARLVKMIEDCPVEGVGKLMFMGDSRDPIEIIDKHLVDHDHLIASSLISRSLSPAYSHPKAGIDLLSIINHSDPGRHTGLYDHAIVRIQLQTLKFLREHEPSQDFLKVMSCVRVILCSTHTIDEPWPSAPALEVTYQGMPEHLKGPEARLSLGLPLTKEQMQAADQKLRDSSFNIDLGL